MNQNTPSLKNLKSQRTRCRSSLSRLVEHLDSLDAKTINIKELKGRRSKLEQVLDQYEAIQAQIEDLTEVECDNDERTDFEQKYFDVLGRISDLISDDSQTDSKVKHDANTPSTDVPSFRLPTITIPEFSGAYEDWTNFYDTFSSLVDSNADIPDIQKFHYLKSALKGTATETLRSLSVSKENYSIAWNMLKKRYDNKRLIVEDHIGAIFDLPFMQKGNPIPLRSILDGIIRHTSALTTLELPVKYWDAILVFLIKKKMDASTNQEWEAHLPDTTSLASLETLTDFLNKKCQTLESLSRNSSTPASVTTSKRMSHVATILNCKICSKNHMVFQCEVFRKMSPEQRINQAKSKQLCLNCLKSNHTTQRCTSQSCKICHKKHNTLLHIHSSSNEIKSSTPTPQAIQESPTPVVSNHAVQQSEFTTALLSTALVEVYDFKGKPQSCRVLLDAGSQCNFISKALINRLGIRGEPFHIPVSGVSKSNTRIKTIVNTKIKSKYNNFQASIKCLVLDDITDNLPQVSVDSSSFDIPKNIKLADPQFYRSGPIDMLLGVNIFWSLLCVGQIKSNSKHPFLQKTHFGWIVAGSSLSNNHFPQSVACNLSITNSLDDKIASFWELENISPSNTYTPDEQACEDHFLSTHTRDESGRFIVKLPFKSNSGNLGDTHNMALKRFYNLEKKLNKNDDLKIQYANFLDEYLKLGHMTLISPEPPIELSQSSYYLPHHAVLKPSSTTTKLRVVFDGSAKSSTGISLNDQLLVGPTVQDDLFSIILRFRTYRIVLTADIAKMYRQVLVHKDDTKFQRILWREDQKMPVQTFELSTVTYGTASASYLATRCLQQLAQEYKLEFPLGSKVTLRDFYVDDLITGTDTVEEAIHIVNQSTSLLSKGGFELRKWCSNNPSIFKDTSISTSPESIHPLDKENVKTLGLVWNSQKDVLSYQLPELGISSKITKRSILSYIASLFDPLGLLGPTVLIGKVIMQRLWQANLNWDESVPLDIHSQFNSYVQDMHCLPEINVSRIVVPSKGFNQIELHGFCDASETAYGACLYIKSIDPMGNASCNLLCAKSRVAPVKSVSIPRLELCGAVLLAQLATKVIEKLNINFKGVWYWTDSTIVLAWLKSPSKQWKTFVANRVNLIHSSTDTSAWHHIPSEKNPADIISRGMLASDLRTSNLWWHGPEFLQASNSDPVPFEVPSNLIIPERRTGTVVLSSICVEPNPIFTRYSKLSKLIRIIAYCIRFTKNSIASLRRNHEDRRSGPLSLAETNLARNRLIKLVQREVFSFEISQLQTSGLVNKKSPLISLNPFLDNDGIIRVGGRLQKANIPYSQQHPVVLPSKHPFTRMIISHFHSHTLHAGTQGTMAAIRKQYWPLALRSVTRQIIRQCVNCFKANPTNREHIMGNLPMHRLEPARPFLNSGVDYCGPFMIRESKRRNSKTCKMYVAVFVCLATKAVHLETVSDLSAEAFINALRRLMARRGKVVNLYSDNATNFVGANKELRELHSMLATEHTKNEIARYSLENNINWHFIPPRAPHFGGLWEAAVKSMKTHFKRVAANASLTLEVFSTLLLEIEAILNSRPLTPLSNDPSDLSFLSPGHFLIGDTLTSIPSPDLADVKLNRLTQWQHIQKIKLHFWKRWKGEYLSQLQQRTKWKLHQQDALSVGQLVIIKEDNVPPLKWDLARVTEIHPGEDGVVRTATVRTQHSTFKRPSCRLCVLPLKHDS